MRTTRPPMRRIQVIDQQIREGKYPNSETVAVEFEVSSRTGQRDFEFMRDQLGAPLDFCRQRNGYFYTDNDFLLPTFHFTEGELVAFFLAERLLKQYRGTPYEADLQRAFERIVEQLPDEITVNLAGLTQTLSVTPTVLTTQDIDTFRALARAVVEEQPLEVSYWTAGRDELTTRRIDPYHLTLIDNDWYIIGYCHVRRDVRTFSALRFRSATVIPGRFRRPENFSIADYLGDSFRALRGEGQHEIVLRFAASAAGRILEKIWHRTQVTELQPDGSLILRMTVSDLREVKRWVLYWGSECLVLAPDEFRRLVRQELSAMLTNSE